MEVKELVVDQRRGRKTVTVFFESGVAPVTFMEGNWVPGADATDAQKAAIRQVGHWLTATVGHSEAQHEG